ncbi:MAG TPA: nucleoside deaminase [Deltaproteobacteria bacterium]|nr:MAG: tRNA-specific adenosine deaminase [Deltaproteobacteria bacterium]RLB08068.1 MAG: tRNA-specific adenosine deaminase [Deltaproteobacteria bacterium]HDM77107.1 nucleoside deaminase [Deltaproteobacteria bacterium]
MDQDVFYMKIALKQAKKAMEFDEVPVGAVLVNESGEILARGFNQPVRSCDPTAHAEIVALREAALLLKNYRLPGSIMYVTLEPCLMCWGAIFHARVKKVVFGASEKKYSAGVSDLFTSGEVSFNHKVEVTKGVLAEECSIILRHFFEKKR